MEPNIIPKSLEKDLIEIVSENEEKLEEKDPNEQNIENKEDEEEMEFEQSATNKSTISSRKEKLRNLFWKYADISEETGIPLMKSRQYLRLLEDTRILDKKRMTKSKAEVIFVSATGRKGMTFDSFFNSLVKLAEIRYQNLYMQNPVEALEQIVCTHLLSFYEQENTTPTKTGTLEANYLELVYEEDVKIMLNSVFPIVKDIYVLYFEEPFKNGRVLSQIVKIASKQILVFARDFDLLRNNYLTKQTAISILETIVRVPDSSLTNNASDPNVFFSNVDPEGNPLNEKYGVYLTLDRFFIFLFWAAISCFGAANEDPSHFSQAGKIFH